MHIETQKLIYIDSLFLYSLQYKRITVKLIFYYLILYILTILPYLDDKIINILYIMKKYFLYSCSKFRHLSLTRAYLNIYRIRTCIDK